MLAGGVGSGGVEGFGSGKGIGEGSGGGSVRVGVAGMVIEHYMGLLSLTCGTIASVESLKGWLIFRV